MSSHKDHQDVGERSDRLDAEPLAFQIGDAAHFFAGKQFDAANHHPAYHLDGRAGVDVKHELRRIGHAEIDATPCDGRRDPGWRRIDKAYVAKPLVAQQRLGDVLRRIADALIFRNPHGGGFERSVGTNRSRHAHEARRACHRKRCETAASGRRDQHWSPSL